VTLNKKPNTTTKGVQPMNPLDLRQLPSAAEVYLCHDEGYFPVLINPRDGAEILAVVRGGAGHVGITGRLDAVRSTDGGQTWEPPTVIVDSDVDDRNPAVGQASDGTIVLAYHAQGSYNDDGSWARELRRVQMRLTRSTDGGVTWETPQPLNYTPMEKFSAYGRILTLPDGTMLLPLYGKDGGRDGAHILRSHDDGRTWDDPSLIGVGYNETGLILLPSGELLAAFRSEDHGQLLAVCRSSDNGQTWSEPAPVTAAREHPADLTLLSNGWIVLYFGVRHEPFGVRALVSKDNGHTWGNRLIVCDDLGDNDLGYPSTVKIEDRLVTAYYCSPRGSNDPDFRGEGAFARALLYSERELVEAIG
jgi:hypothetical protein